MSLFIGIVFFGLHRWCKRRIARYVSFSLRKQLTYRKRIFFSYMSYQLFLLEESNYHYQVISVIQMF